MVAAAELGADPGERHVGVLAAEVHGEVARHGEARRAPRARELVAAQAVVLAHLADDALEARPAARHGRGPERLAHERQVDRPAGERRVRLDARERALELAHVGAPLLGEVARHLRREAHPEGARLALDERAAQRRVGRLHVREQPRGEAVAQRLLDAREVVRGAVRGEHDLARALVERVEGVGELLLRAALLGQELDVVDDQRLDAAELPPEAVHASRLEGGDHLVHEVLRGEAHHRAERARVGQAGRHRGEQVGLAEPAAAAEEERVEAGAGLRHHRARRPIGDAVRLSDHEVVEGVARRRAVGGVRGPVAGERPGARRYTQLPIDQQEDRRRRAGRLGHRALERGEEVLPQPVTRKAARRLECERVGGPARRTQRRDPRIVVLVEQLAAQPAPRFDPDDVRHPRPLFDPTRAGLPKIHRATRSTGWGKVAQLPDPRAHPAAAAPRRHHTAPPPPRAPQDGRVQPFTPSHRLERRERERELILPLETDCK